MKIEMVVPSLPTAGMEHVVARLTHGLARRGHDVGITCTEYKGAIADELEAAGFRVQVVPTLGLRTILFPNALRRWFRERDPDVIHIHTGVWLKGARAARLAGVRLTIHTMHGRDGVRPRYEPLLDRLAARCTDVTVAVSEALIPYLTTKAHVPEGRLRVITNGVDAERFHPGRATGRIRTTLGFDARHVVVGHVARLSPVKNHAMLLDAFAYVAREHSHARLALVGDGPLRDELKERAQSLGLESRVGFLGALDDMPDVYRDLDIAVLPSLSEATSMSLLEAMATGLPIVATAVGGTPTLLGHGQAGMLVESNDVQGLADALSNLIRSPESRARLGAAARQRAESMYSEERMLDAYESIYRGMTA